MANTFARRSHRQLLTDAEIREFQSLAAAHARASLTIEQAEVLAHQLLRALWIIRKALVRGSTDSVSPVDGKALPDSRRQAITTSSISTHSDP